ncbi:dynein regulatory complex protein 10 isoform 2-T2 [Menidia menidia]
MFFQILNHLFLWFARRKSVLEKGQNTSGKEAAGMADNQSEVALLFKKNKLSLEARRVSNIVEKCINEVEAAAALPCIHRIYASSNVVDSDLSKALEAHQLLKEKLEKNDSLKQESAELHGAKGEDARKTHSAQLEKDIKRSVRNVIRCFRANPNALVSIKAALDVELGESESNLIKTLQIFHNHTIERLFRLDEEPQPSSPSFRNVENLILHEKQSLTHLKEKNEWLTLQISEREREIRHLEKDLGNIREENLPALQDTHAQQNMKILSTKLSSLQKEADELSLQLNSLMLENKQAERVLQEKNKMLETEIEKLIQTFDGQMEEIEAKLELNEREYEKEQEEVKKLEELFPALERACNKIQEKRRLAEEKRIRETRELELKTKAAIVIQAWWRGYSIRKTLKNKGKKKKGKKGKGKRKK